LDRRTVDANQDQLFALIRQRVSLIAGGAPLAPLVEQVDILADRQALRFTLRFVTERSPDSFVVRASLFPYDANHQTFVNVYEAGALRHQGIFNASRTSLEYFPGTVQGTLAVVCRFIVEGIRHIAIGPDHILFLVGLLLLGGSLMQLVRIVTAFTIAHVTRQSRDVRAWIALAFGLIHGFGFASVLRGMDLPRQALGWSLFSFNVGVEIGQVAIVIAVAAALAAVRRSSEAFGRHLVHVGSAAVIGAGAYWFVERVFFPGGL
jgi:hypothetical protein